MPHAVNSPTRYFLRLRRRWLWRCVSLLARPAAKASKPSVNSEKMSRWVVWVIGSPLKQACACAASRAAHRSSNRPNVVNLSSPYTNRSSFAMATAWANTSPALAKSRPRQVQGLQGLQQQGQAFLPGAFALEAHLDGGQVRGNWAGGQYLSHCAHLLGQRGGPGLGGHENNAMFIDRHFRNLKMFHRFIDRCLLLLFF